MSIREAIRSILTWFTGPGSEPSSVVDHPNVAPGPSSDTARRLSAANDYELSAALERLAPGQRGYISAEDYEEIAAEQLDEFSVAGREIIRDVAVGCRCTIDYRPGEWRVYFTRATT